MIEQQLSLSFRAPFAASMLLDFLGRRAVSGIETYDGNTYRRTLRLSFGTGILELAPAIDHVQCSIRLDDERDLAFAIQRSRVLLDLDADPVTIDQALSEDAALRPLVASIPGVRVPGHVDGNELAIRAVLGQQVSVAGARTLTARLVQAHGKPLTVEDEGLTHLFPEPDALAEADLSGLGVPRQRQHAIRSLAGALASGGVDLGTGADRLEARTRLLDIPGIGPWTASYIAMRALGDPDAFPASDLGIRAAFERLGLESDLRSIEERAQLWRPWRAYAVQHLWASLSS